MPVDGTASQLGTLLDRQATMAGDVRVILVRLEALPKLEQRVSNLEAGRARLSAWWGGAAIIGGAIGYALSFLPRPR